MLPSETEYFRMASQMAVEGFDRRASLSPAQAAALRADLIRLSEIACGWSRVAGCGAGADQAGWAPPAPVPAGGRS